MKTILVPVDFSDTARHVIDYALGIAQQLNAAKIILYNAFQPPVQAAAALTDGTITDPGYNTIGYYDINALTDSSKEHLERLKATISSTYTGTVAIETIGEFNVLREGIEEVCGSQNVDAVVMGISEAGAVSETLVGSSSIDIARHITTPVIIVPADAVAGKPVQQILFTCDYDKVSSTTPVAAIKNIVSATGAQLHILHIDADAEKPEHIQQKGILQQLLHDVNTSYHGLINTDFTAAVNSFIEQNNIDLIIAIPKKHGFFEGLFHKSHTKALAFHSHVPVMLVHE